MTSADLRNVIAQSAGVLRGAATQYATAASKCSLPNDSQSLMKSLHPLAAQLNATSSLLDARDAAEQIVAGLQKATDKGTEQVVVFGQKVSFTAARFLSFSTYLSASWSISDALTAVGGELVTTTSVRNRPGHTAKLWEHFLKSGSNVSAYLYDVLSNGYAWPCAISYAVRNHFVHDGAQKDGRSFFKGPGLSDGFEISNDGWDFLEKKLREEYKVKEAQTRSGLPWPWYQNDLFSLLKLCHDEMDEAIEAILVWATKAVEAQTTCLLVRDLK